MDQNKETSSRIHELTFTKDDRRKVFEKIHMKGYKSQRLSKKIYLHKRFIPLMATFAAILLVITVGLSTHSINEADQQYNRQPASGSYTVNDAFTILFMIEDEGKRTIDHLFFTYNNIEKSMKSMAIPRDTYVEVGGGEKGKLTNAHAYGNGPDFTMNAVEKLMQIPMDFYIKMDVESFVKAINSSGGLEVTIPKKTKIKIGKGEEAVLTPGVNKLSGNETLGLLTTMIEYPSYMEWDEKETNNVFTLLVQEAINHLYALRINSEIETNLTWDELEKIAPTSIEYIDLIQQSVPFRKDEIYYVEINPNTLLNVSNELNKQLQR